MNYRKKERLKNISLIKKNDHLKKHAIFAVKSRLIRISLLFIGKF